MVTKTATIQREEGERVLASKKRVKSVTLETAASLFLSVELNIRLHKMHAGYVIKMKQPWVGVELQIKIRERKHTHKKHLSVN